MSALKARVDPSIGARSIYPTPDGGTMVEATLGPYEVSAEQPPDGRLLLHCTDTRTMSTMFVEEYDPGWPPCLVDVWFARWNNAYDRLPRR